MSLSVKPTGSRTPDFRQLQERLWYAREKSGLTQQELADLLGISRKTVQNYEAGVGCPRPNRLLLWANATDFDYDWLAGDFYGSGPTDGSDTASTSGLASQSLRGLIAPTRLDDAYWSFYGNSVAA